jgi:phytoene synthase
MKPSHDILQASYAYCRDFSRRSGSNFYLGFRFLPKDKRQAMDAVYAFMRCTDDLADAEATSFRHGFPVSVETRRDALRRWRGLLEAVLSGDYRFGQSAASREGAGPFSELIVRSEYLLPALVDTIERFSIPPRFFHDVIDGVEMDLDRRRYETFEELELYCLRVASAVGLACIHIWGFRGQGSSEAEAALAPARQAGIALQLTNILRDLKADADADRVYLPLEDLRNCDYSVEELKKGVVNKAFLRLMDMQFDRARQLYQEGCRLFDFLNPDGRRIFGLMTTVYRSLLEKIARRPGDVFSRGVKISKFNRIIIFLYWSFIPSHWTVIPSIMAEKDARNDKR